MVLIILMVIFFFNFLICRLVWFLGLGKILCYFYILIFFCFVFFDIVEELKNWVVLFDVFGFFNWKWFFFFVLLVKS